MNEKDQKDVPHRNRAWQRRDIVGVGLAAVLCATLLAMNAMVWRPALARAKQTSCSSNLRQLSNGLMQYIREYDEMMPPHGKWAQSLVPYVKPRQNPIFQCPSRQDLPLGYAMHDKVPGVTLSDFNDPLRIIWLFDAEATGANMEGRAEILPSSARHPGGHAVVFMDGHAKFVANPDFTKGFFSVAQLQERRKRRDTLEELDKSRGKLQAAVAQELLRNRSLKPKDRSYTAARKLEAFNRITSEIGKGL